MNARHALALLACCAAFASLDGRAATFGLHIGSAHVPAKDHHRNENPGLYFQHERLVAGVYRNSIGRTTFYGAYAHPLGAGFDLLAGVGSGYQQKGDLGFSRGALTPVVGCTYTAPIKFAGASPRLWVIPGTSKSSTVAHLSLQWAL